MGARARSRGPGGLSGRLKRTALAGLMLLFVFSGCAVLKSQPRYRSPEPAPAAGRQAPGEKVSRAQREKAQRDKAREERKAERLRKDQRRDARKGGGLPSFRLFPFSRGPSDLLEAAYEYLGVPYRFGGDSPRGMDCSGLVWRAAQEAWDRELPRNSAEMAKLGMPVSRSELAPGDLVFFHTGRRGRISHVGIYEGGGRFLHASTTKGVEVTTMDEGYWHRRLVCARRITPSSISR